MSRHRTASWRLLMRALLLLLLILSATATAVAQTAAKKPDWTLWSFLIGDWVSDGPKERGAGAFSFRPELDGMILVRRNRAELPADAQHPAAPHQDLLLLYPEEHSLRADYFDNEGHVIHYRATVASDGKSATFTSDPAPHTPRYRLSYSQLPEDRVSVRFEIAPPAQPD